mgnify:CR=1 FL=1
MKIVLIGLDGATWKLIEPWALSGKLPTFKKLIIDGACGILKSTLPPISPTAWTSIFSGLKPTKHHVWSVITFDGKTYTVKPLFSHDINVPMIWNVLSYLRIRGVYMNIPFYYPPPRINGIFISGFGTPNRSSRFTYPLYLREEILGLFPDYDIDYREDSIPIEGIEAASRIFRITQAQMEAFMHIFKNEQKKSQLFIFVIRSPDVVQHFFWTEKRIILHFYKQIDLFLHKIVRNLDKDDILILCSDHGFRTVDKKVYLVNILENLGILRIKKDQINSFFYEGLLNSKIYKSLLERSKRLIRELFSRHASLSILSKIIKSTPFSEITYMGLVDWYSTLAYYLPGSYGVIRINLKEREGKGIITSHNFDAIRKEIIESLLAIKEEESGEKVFEIVKTCEAIYGECNDADIILYTKEGYGIAEGFNIRKKLIERMYPINGGHDLEGIICVYGRSIPSTRLRDLETWDVAALLYYLLGIEPAKMGIDGRVPKELSNIETSCNYQYHYGRMKLMFNIESIKKKLKSMRSNHYEKF